MPSVVRALCDASPLIALFDLSDEAHERCTAALKEFTGGFVTTWPVLTEAFHFIDRPKDRSLLWNFVLSDVVRVDDILATDLGKNTDIDGTVRRLTHGFCRCFVGGFGGATKGFQYLHAGPPRIFGFPTT